MPTANVEIESAANEEARRGKINRNISDMIREWQTSLVHEKVNKKDIRRDLIEEIARFRRI